MLRPAKRKRWHFVTRSWFPACIIFFSLTAPAFAGGPPQEPPPPASPLLPLASPQADDQWVEEGLNGPLTVGGGGVGVDTPSAKFGEYLDLENKDGFFVGEMDLHYFKDSRYFELQGDNLGLENRRVYFETGNFSGYRFNAEYEQIPHILSRNSTTIFQGLGTNNLTLPAGFGTGLTTPGLAPSSNSNVDLEIDDWRNLKFGLTKFFGEGGRNEARLSFNRMSEEGIKSLGGVTGLNPGLARAVILPEAFKQTSHEIEATLAHNADHYQVELGYTLSVFNNRVESITYQNPFQGTIMAFGLTETLPTQARLSRAPDNQFHQVSLSGGMDLPFNSRISATGQYGLMVQDENLLPFSTGTTTALLPRQTADAEIHTIHGTVSLVSNPLPGLGLRAKFRHYETVNDTPRTLFLAVINDTNAPVTAASERALNSLPYEYRKNQVNLDASYRVFDRTTLKLGYDLELMDRNFRATDETTEHTGHVLLRSNWLSFLRADLKASYSNRDAGAYNSFQVYTTRHSSGFITPATMPATPLDFRQFDIADREKVQYGANFMLTPLQMASIGFAYNYSDEDYNESLLGLDEIRDHNFTVDLNVTPVENLNLFTWYTYDDAVSTQDGRNHVSFIPTSILDTTRNWAVVQDQSTHTVGFGLSSSLFNNRLTARLDYSINWSETAMKFSEGGNMTLARPLAVPELNTTQSSVEGSLQYKVDETLQIGFSLLHQSYESDSYFTDFAPSVSSSVTNVLLLSNSIPDTDAQLGMMWLTYHFGKK